MPLLPNFPQILGTKTFAIIVFYEACFLIIINNNHLVWFYENVTYETNYY